MADLTGVRVLSKSEFKDRIELKKLKKAHRKPKFETVLTAESLDLYDRTCVNIRYSDREFLSSLGDGSISKGLRIAVDLARGRLTEITEAVLASKTVKRK